MSAEPKVIDPRCCTSGCKRCPFQDAEPASKWCERCMATVYVDERNRCIPCSDFAPLKRTAFDYAIASPGSDEEKQLLATLVERIQGSR